MAIYWIVTFNDGTVIEQYDQNGNERKFKEVLDRIQDVKTFVLSNGKEHLVTVDLVNGLIILASTPVIDVDLINTKQNVRLIYFKRHYVRSNGVEDLAYFVGFQYDDKQGNNRKLLVKLTETGIAIGVK